MSSTPKKVAIGIDLGSSKCCVGVVRDGKVEIIENERGNKTTPSYVAFTDTTRLIGEDAKDQATLNPTNTVFGVKRIMGRKGDDPILMSYKENVQFVVDNNEQPVINVKYKNEAELLLPQQITAMLLTKMKEMAETHLVCEVYDAVISVPACFTNAQRQATKDAAQIAGLNVLRLINEPTAAAIAYEANRRTTAAETVVVVDFGGGKLDVSVIDIAKRSVKVRALSGNSDFGGNDMDDALKDFFLQKCNIFDANEMSPKVSERVRLKCRQLKHSLTLLPNAQQTLDCFGDSGDVLMSLTREELATITQNRVQSSVKSCLNTALSYSGCTAKQISRLLLVGGSTRIPMVQDVLLDYFSKMHVDKSLNPDEAVAYGAAVQAAVLAGDHTLQDVQVFDVVPYGINVGSKRVFHPYKTIPTIFNGELTQFSTASHGVFELVPKNCSKDAYNSRHVGDIFLSQEFGKAACLISGISFEIDANGIFETKVVLKPKHVFSRVGEKYDEKEADKKADEMRGKEEQFKKDTVAEKERVVAMMNLETSCHKLKLRAEKCKNEACLKFTALILDETSGVLNWLDTTRTASKDMYEERTEFLESLGYSFKKKLKIEKE